MQDITPEISLAGQILREGGLVAFPTETVYGLGGDATNDTAVARIFEAKGRPQFNPLISHVVDAAAAFALGVFTPQARKLADAFWPGPLTIVVPRSANCPVSLLVDPKAAPPLRPAPAQARHHRRRICRRIWRPPRARHGPS